MGKKFILLCTFSAIFLFIFSCSNQTVYSSEVEIPDGIWKSKEAAVFSPELTDTIQNYNISLSVTNSDLYRYSNLWLFVKTKSPDGFYHKDTLEIYLSEENGKWLGKNKDDQWRYQFYFKKQIRFPKIGKYTFEIQQGMRDLELPGINKLSFELLKSDK